MLCIRPAQIHEQTPTAPQRETSTQNPVAVAADGDSIRLQKADLAPGDVLLQRDPGDLPVYKAIKLGQRFAGLNLLKRNRGKASRIHAALWTQRPGRTRRTSALGPGDAEITEARAETNSVLNSAVLPGEFEVFRPRDAQLGTQAANVARHWGDARTIPYNAKLATLSVFRSSRFTRDAERTAERAARDAESAAPEIAREGMYCSQLVVAAYQAAALRLLPGGAEKLAGALRVNSRVVSPRMLHHLLVGDADRFQKIGRIRVTPADVPYAEELYTAKRSVTA